MSWQEDLENIVFTIKTGDGEDYSPKWKNATKDVEYNSSIFEFVNVEGSLVLRKKHKGRKFDLEFYFDGENAVQQGNNFEISARNEKYWQIKHPFYGDFYCQPLTLRQDNSFYNVSKFTVSVVETITTNDTTPEIIIEDEIISQVSTVNESQAVAFNNSKELDKVDLAKDVNALDAIYSRIIKTNEEYLEFKSKVSDAIVEINSSSSTGLSILREINSIINYPATIQQTVEARYTAIKEAFENIIANFDGNKNQFEAVGGGIISSMFLASITDFDYKTRSKVIAQQEDLVLQYNSYLEFLDSLQTERADSDGSYSPNFNGQKELGKLANMASANIFNISFTLKQEREFTLEKDSNAILLTHKFYGLDEDDENLNTFIGSNNISLNELLNIKKGRKIVYYV